MKIKVDHIVLTLLLVIPSIVNLIVPLYNKAMPDLFGIPFFYCFQTMWLVVCSGCYLTYAYLVKNKQSQQQKEDKTMDGVSKSS
jgi:hypothetical protein